MGTELCSAPGGSDSLATLQLTRWRNSWSIPSCCSKQQIAAIVPWQAEHQEPNTTHRKLLLVGLPSRKPGDIRGSEGHGTAKIQEKSQHRAAWTYLGKVSGKTPPLGMKQAMN